MPWKLSDLFNQTVPQEAFRDYTKNDALGERVKRTYTEMHTKQVNIKQVNKTSLTCEEQTNDIY